MLRLRPNGIVETRVRRTTVVGVTGLRPVALGLSRAATALPNEDGYRLWLRYAPLGAAAAAPYRALIRQVVVEGDSPTAGSRATNSPPRCRRCSAWRCRSRCRRARRFGGGRHAGLVSSDSRARLERGADPARARRLRDSPRARGWPRGDRRRVGGRGGRAVRRVSSAAAGADRPAARERQRLGAAQACSCGCSITGTISTARSSAATRGRSLWQWADLPGTVDPRYVDYARANASIGINGAVDQQRQRRGRTSRSWRRSTCAKVAAIANVFRPYGVRMYLSANFSAPVNARALGDGRPARSGGDCVVEGEGRRNLRVDSGLRRLLRQGQLGGAARSQGLQAHSRRGRQPAWPTRSRRTGGTSSGGRSSTTRTSIRTAPSAPTSSSRSSTASSDRTCSSRSRTARSTSCRASRSIRCSAR